MLPHIVKDNEPVKDHDLGLHPSEQAPYGYQVKRVGNRYLPMRRDTDGMWRGWTRCDTHGVPVGALTFATARAATRFCRRRDNSQP